LHYSNGKKRSLDIHGFGEKTSSNTDSSSLIICSSHPNLVQLYGIVSSPGLHATAFHDSTHISLPSRQITHVSCFSFFRLDTSHRTAGEVLQLSSFNCVLLGVSGTRCPRLHFRARSLIFSASGFLSMACTSVHIFQLNFQTQDVAQYISSHSAIYLVSCWS
jgi:hypothetical protein